MNTQKSDATLIFGNVDPIFIKLAKRLQQIADLSGNGLAVVTLAIFLVDGEPVQWTRPEISNLATMEPKGNSDVFCDKLRNIRN